MNKKLLPQANTFSLIVKVFRYIGLKKEFTKEDIAEYCEFKPRQSDYYIGACIYLGLLDGNCNLTDIGKDIIENDIERTKERIFELIIQDKLLGKFFSHIAIYPQKTLDEHKSYAANLVREAYKDCKYSEAVICRRSSAMLGWCVEVLEYIKSH